MLHIHPDLMWLTLHLDQELCLDAAGGLALILVPGAAQRVHLVNEDDRGLVLASQVEQVLHKPGRDSNNERGCDTSSQSSTARQLIYHH